MVEVIARLNEVVHEDRWRSLHAEALTEGDVGLECGAKLGRGAIVLPLVKIEVDPLRQQSRPWEGFHEYRPRKGDVVHLPESALLVCG